MRKGKTMSGVYDVEKFIRSVRSKPQLWNKLDPMYRNTEMRNTLWKQVSQEMGGKEKTNELKQKWHNLRDIFRRELRKNKLGKKKRRWAYYDDMLFLYPGMGVDSENVSNDIPEPKMEEEILVPVKNETICEDQVLQEDQSYNHSPVPNPLGNENDSVRLEEPKIQILTPDVIDSRTFGNVPDDDDYHFAMSIVPHMKRIPIHRKLRMRIKISEIIAQETVCSDPNYNYA